MVKYILSYIQNPWTHIHTYTIGHRTLYIKKQEGPIVNWSESNESVPNSKIIKKNSEMILNYYKLRGYPQSVLTSAKIRAPAWN